MYREITVLQYSPVHTCSTSLLSRQCAWKASRLDQWWTQVNPAAPADDCKVYQVAPSTDRVVDLQITCQRKHECSRQCHQGTNYIPSGLPLCKIDIVQSFCHGLPIIKSSRIIAGSTESYKIKTETWRASLQRMAAWSLGIMLCRPVCASQTTQMIQWYRDWNWSWLEPTIHSWCWSFVPTQHSLQQTSTSVQPQTLVARLLHLEWVLIPENLIVSNISIRATRPRH